MKVHVKDPSAAPQDTLLSLSGQQRDLGSDNSTNSSALKLWIRLSEDLKQRDNRLRPMVEKLGQPTIQFEKNHFRALVESCLLYTSPSPRD